jgi:hypothetical protein
VAVAAGQGNRLDRHTGRLAQELFHGLLQPLLADPLARATAQPLAKGVLQCTTAVVASPFQITEAERLIQIGADVVDEVIKTAASLPMADAQQIGRRILHELGPQPGHNQAQQHIIEAQLPGQARVAADTRIQMSDQGMQLTGPHPIQLLRTETVEVRRPIVLWHKRSRSALEIGGPKHD